MKHESASSCEQKHLKCAMGYNLRQREWADYEMCLRNVCPMEYCRVAQRKENQEETKQ